MPEFADAAASHYAAVAESADFSSEPELAKRRVNAFVSEATRGLIADILPPGSVYSSTVLVLANALYFKPSRGPGLGRSTRREPSPRRSISPAATPCARRS